MSAAALLGMFRIYFNKHQTQARMINLPGLDSLHNTMEIYAAAVHYLFLVVLLANSMQIPSRRRLPRGQP